MGLINGPPKQEVLDQWEAFLDGRPAEVIAVFRRFPVWELFRMKSTGQRVQVVAVNEHEGDEPTLTVAVRPEWNFVTFGRNVFGIPLDDLEPCELPGPDELVGAMLDEHEVDANIDELRLMVRPDLFERDTDGAVVRKV